MLMPEYLQGRRNEKIQQNFYVIYKLEVFIYLIDVMNSVFDKVSTNYINCILLLKYA